METSYHTLSNGLRCVHRLVRGAAECCGVMIDAGSRDEAPADYGLAHFVEHTVFKGTRKRKAWHIINRMEAVGGELNAYTTKECTAVYTSAPRGNMARSIELLADLLADSVFPDRELDKEREVVADEIDSYLDMPSEAVFDDFDESFFKGNALAHNILGTEQTVASFNSADCRRWISDRYTAASMVYFYSGSAGARRVWECAERYLSRISAVDVPCPRTAPVVLPPFSISRNVGSHQSHTLMGARIGGLYSPDRFAMSLLTNIIGGSGMNSLLNVALRERRGLVYTVEASTTHYTDCGLLSIYFGCDHNDTARCTELTAAVLDDIRRRGLSATRLAMAKRQYLGQMALAGENRENNALAMGRGVLYHGRILEPAEMRRRIENITADDIMRCAEALDPALFSTLTLC